jgi:hypothetical protein
MAGTTANNAWPYPTDTDYVYLGAQAIEALADGIDTSTGTGLLAWTSYTPTFTNFTLGNGTITLAKFKQLGKLVFVKVLVTLGSTSSVSGRIGFTLPVTATADNTDRTIGTAGLLAGGVSSTGFVAIGTTTRADLYALLASGTYVSNTNTSSTIPGTWAAASTFSATFTYEAA